ncbi:HK97 family phage prohead protease [Clostridium sporogenes]|uniref:HK97 family phage prohead protease n=1 Tax=Clostridium sporogenes TaxID=1509 RepID=UPI003F908CD2
MRVEIRSDHAIIKGYINSVERDSREMTTAKGGFVEQVRSGTWKNAISKKDDIPMLLNHNKNRRLASTKEKTLKLIEDNIGLYAEARVYDKEVIKKAENNELTGWSFGFSKIKDSWGKSDSGVDRRYLEEIDVTEVSVLDDTRTPAYFGTSIENRDNIEINIEQRAVADNVEISIEEVKTKENEERELKLKLLNLELEL